MPGDDAGPAVPRTLFVYVPGITEKPAKSVELLARLRAQLPEDLGLTWTYPKPVRLFTRGPFERCALAFCEDLQQYWESVGAPERIILIGHSLGGVLVRYAYLLALGVIDDMRRPWAQHVWRIVLLAAPNRGLDMNRFDRPTRWLVGFGFWALRGLAALQVQTGSAFMTNLRLTWTREAARNADRWPLTVQVRGDRDALVEREDSRDIEGAQSGVQLVLPGADHADIMLVSGAHETFPGQRWALLRKATLDEQLASTEPARLPEAERRYRCVVFVLHGIRAGNDTWVSELRALLEADTTALVVTASYGRLSAYNFAVPVTRRRTLHWFQDQYSYYLARHPQLPFHFVGHSNGTYVLGRSLGSINTMRFNRVYLAGSVLNRSLDWRPLSDQGQVVELVNVCASQDKPVAWLCSGLNGLGMRDVGVGGFVGFDLLPGTAHQIRYLPGGHDAALRSDRLPAIADYVLTGKVVQPDGLVRPSPWFAQVSRLIPVAAWLLAIGAAATVASAIMLTSVLPVVLLAGVLLLAVLVLKVI